MDWNNVSTLVSKKYKCGYCGSPLASQIGYIAKGNIGGITKMTGCIYICHSCEKPTFFDYFDNQTPE